MYEVKFYKIKKINKFIIRVGDFSIFLVISRVSWKIIIKNRENMNNNVD